MQMDGVRVYIAHTALSSANDHKHRMYGNLKFSPNVLILETI